MESRKMVLMDLFAEQQWRWRHRQENHDHGGVQRKWGVNGESSMEAYTLPGIKQSMGTCCMTQGTETGAL